ncbi:MAG: hypothetical protein HYY63_05635, partial [Elusimicrobia bacterium]|nr:hypothetical protein [Elusimicrobiota bacterium]
NIPQGSRLLFVGERRAAGFRRRFYAASGYDRTQFEDWISKVDDARGFYAILKEKGVTHLIMNPSGIVSLDPKKGELYSEFLSRYSEALIRTANGNLLVYKII